MNLMSLLVVGVGLALTATFFVGSPFTNFAPAVGTGAAGGGEPAVPAIRPAPAHKAGGGPADAQAREQWRERHAIASIPKDKTLRVTVPAMKRVDNAAIPYAGVTDETAFKYHAGVVLEGFLVEPASVGESGILYTLHGGNGDAERLVLGNVGGRAPSLSLLGASVVRPTPRGFSTVARDDRRHPGLAFVRGRCLDGGGRVGERGAYEEGRRQGETHPHQEQAHNVQDRVPGERYWSLPVRPEVIRLDRNPLYTKSGRLLGLVAKVVFAAGTQAPGRRFSP